MNDYISKQNAIDLWHKFQPYIAVKAMEYDNALAKLPSAQPEVIRCKDCKWKQGSECVRFADVRPFPDDYCSRAERKEA